MKKLAAMVISLLFLELLLQIISFCIIPSQHSLSSPDDELGWIFQGPGINSFGCRDSEPGYIKYMYLGDSVTMGLHVDSDKTFAALLGGYNAGFDGYDTYQEVVKYKRDLCRLQPENLILVVCPNDYHLHQKMIRTSSYFRWEALYKLYAYRKYVLSNDPDMLDAWYYKRVMQPIDDDIWIEWTSCLLALNRESNLSIVLLPPRVQTQKGWLNKHLREFCSSNGIPFFDPLLKDQKYYVDPIHLSEAGHREVAARIAQWQRQGT